MQSTVQSVLNMKELRSTCNKGLEVPCQNTFKDKPAFIEMLIKVLVARNLFLVPSSSCRLETIDSSGNLYAQTKVAPMNLLQCII